MTVIGSPFWMAPEVIKEVGYSCLADIWSLGITIIEMAELVPPRSDIHPMKVLLKIPVLPSPALEEPHSFSKEMVSFLDATLKKKPSERWTSDALKGHAWIGSKSVSPARVVDLVNTGRELIAKYGGREAAMRSRDDDETEGDVKIQSHDELMKMALDTVQKARKNSGAPLSSSPDAMNLSPLDELAWQGEGAFVREGVKVNLSANSNAAEAADSSGTVKRVDSGTVKKVDAPKKRAARRTAVDRAAVKIDKADNNQVTAVSVTKKKKKKPAPATAAADAAPRAATEKAPAVGVAASTPLRKSSSSPTQSPVSSPVTPSASKSGAVKLPPDAANVMKKLTKILRAVRGISEACIQKSLSKEDCLKALEQCAMSVVSISSDAGFNHPHCLHSVEKLNRLRAKATAMVVAMEDGPAVAAANQASTSSSSSSPASSPPSNASASAPASSQVAKPSPLPPPVTATAAAVVSPAPTSKAAPAPVPAVADAIAGEMPKRRASLVRRSHSKPNVKRRGATDQSSPASNRRGSGSFLDVSGGIEPLSASTDNGLSLAAAAPSGGAPVDFMAALQSVHLEGFHESLVKLGCERVSDINFLGDEDLDGIGMKVWDKIIKEKDISYTHSQRNFFPTGCTQEKTSLSGRAITGCGWICCASASSCYCCYCCIGCTKLSVCAPSIV